MPLTNPIKVILRLAKETRNTVRYNADESDDTAAIDSIYVKKFALNGSRPEKIQVTIETK